MATKRSTEELVAYCRERIALIEANLPAYGTSRGRAMIEAYQAVIDHADSSPLLIDCLGEIEDNEALDRLFGEGGEQ